MTSWICWTHCDTFWKTKNFLGPIKNGTGYCLDLFTESNFFHVNSSHWLRNFHSYQVQDKLYSGSISMSQMWFQNMYQWKVQKIYFFYLHCTWNPHEILKEFWKYSHFENLRAGLLLRCQNSLWREIKVFCHWNIDSLKQKLSFGYIMVPKNNQKII